MTYFESNKHWNVFNLRRLEASKTNSALKSRTETAKLLGISRSRLARIELSESAPYAEEVFRMADVYQSPELMNYFCRNFCTIGREIMPVVELLDFDRMMRKATAGLHRVCNIQSELIELGAEDGVLKTDDKEKLMRIQRELHGIMKVAMELDLFIKKNERM
ncbi:MAG: helix-turn-helix domain-containing protein [Selenomonadaceae bacterium]